MSTLPMLLALFLFANLLAALARVIRGPTAGDRLLAALLLGTTGVAILLVLAFAGASIALVDVALVFSLLTTVAGTAFAQRAWRPRQEEQSHELD